MLGVFFFSRRFLFLMAFSFQFGSVPKFGSTVVDVSVRDAKNSHRMSDHVLRITCASARRWLCSMKRSRARRKVYEGEIADQDSRDVMSK